VSLPLRGQIQWEDLAVEIAAIGRLPVERVVPEAGLIDDLGYDSLAVAELIVLLTEEYEITTLPGDLETRDWSKVTVGQLREECGGGTA